MNLPPNYSIALDETLQIARQIAEALEAAHELGIVHRDLKPANIKVRSDGTVKVLDFGLAKAIEPLSSSADSAALVNSPTITSPAALTRAGVILSTAAYMSPEQAKGRGTDRRAARRHASADSAPASPLSRERSQTTARRHRRCPTGHRRRGRRLGG